MATIQFTERRPVRQGHPATRALAQAAVAAGRASSIFNRQPWRWRIADDVAELYADREAPPPVDDPDGRLLAVSCGAALHHARTALAGAGFAADVTYLPDSADPDLLARIRAVAAGAPPPAAVRLQLAMALRGAGRRLIADVEVPPAVLARLRDAAEAYGTHVNLLRLDDVDAPTSAGGRRTRRSSRHAWYVVLSTDRDTRADWLAAGEALSAVLLTATEERLAAAPISDLVEAPDARRRLHDALGGAGYPVIALRVGSPER